MVDTRQKKVIARIEADPYPVGLDISGDGRMLVSTAQGRNGVGGNAVNIFDIEYFLPEIPLESVEMVEEPLAAKEIAHCAPEENQDRKVGQASKEFWNTDLIIPLVLAITVFAILLVILVAVKSKR